MKIDELLDLASDSLRRSIHDVEIPDLPRERESNHTRVLVVAAIIIVLTCGVIALAIARENGESNQPAVGTPSTTTRDHFGLGATPKNMVITVATDGQSSRGTSTYAGLFDQRYVKFDSTRTRPDAVLDILSGANPQGQDLGTLFRGFAGGLGYSVDPIEVGGRPGINIGPLIAWTEDDGQVIAVRAPVDVPTLLQIAEGIEKRDINVYEASYVPAGYEHVGDIAPFVREEADSMVQFRHKQGGRSLQLSVVKNAMTPLIAQLADKDTRLVTVRGHQGLLLTGPMAQSPLAPRLQWDERPDLRIELSADATISDDELLRAASDLVPLTEKQWVHYGAPHSVLHTTDVPANLKRPHQ